MQLSYTSRLICVALCSAGVLQPALEGIAWMLAPRWIARESGTDARHNERTLFAILLLVRLSPWLVALGAWLPAYVRGEDNLSAERVGLLPIIAAWCVFGLWLFRCLRLLRASLLTHRCCRQCEPAGYSPEGLPVLLHPGRHPLLAVAGIFRPRILVSRSLLAKEGFTSAALEVAFLHENAHARHRDNLKRAILTLIPYFPLASRRNPSLDQHWQLAAELAADEAGAMGVPERSILLADLLVRMAREAGAPALHGAFALLSNADDLRIRVERLLPELSPLHGLAAPQAGIARMQTTGLLAVAFAGVAALCYLGAEAGHRLAEVMLHLG